MVGVLIHGWGWFFLAAALLNIPVLVVFVKRFLHGTKDALKGVDDELDKANNADVEEGKETGVLVDLAVGIFGKWFGSYAKSMAPALLLGLVDAVLYLLALIGFVLWLINAATTYHT